MARRGRPRANLEKKILLEMTAHDKRLENVVGEKLGLDARFWKSLDTSRRRSVWAFEAACLRLTLEQGNTIQKARSERLIQRLRKAKRARLYCTLPNKEFLEHFIAAHAPGWDWRTEAQQGRIEDENYKRENERIAKGHAEDVRFSKAWTNKFWTPEVPDFALLYRLPRIRAIGPTLRELKMATAIPERTLKRIIANLRPRQSEIVRQLREKFSRRGGMPNCFGPRLVAGVLHEFLERLPHYSMEDEERERCRKAAMKIKRVLNARPSSTAP